MFTGVTDLGTVICPKGRFHPCNWKGQPFTITDFPNSNDNNWNLKCIKHNSGYFLAFYFYNGEKALYGYSSNRKIWDGTNKFHDGLYGVRIKETPIGDNSEYPILVLAQDGPYLKFIGAKQTLKNFDNQVINRANCETRTIAEMKTNTVAYMNDNNDLFFYLTYNKTHFSIGYSDKPSVGDYENNDNIKAVGITMKNDLSII